MEGVLRVKGGCDWLAPGLVSLSLLCFEGVTEDKEGCAESIAPKPEAGMCVSRSVMSDSLGGSLDLFCFAKRNVSVMCFGGIISSQNKESGSQK